MGRPTGRPAAHGEDATAESLVFVSQLLDAAIVTDTGEAIGTLKDVVIGNTRAASPRILGIIARIHHKDHFIIADEIAALDRGSVYLDNDGGLEIPFEPEGRVVLARRDLLDQHIVDANGCRARLNDIAIGGANGRFFVKGIDASFRGFLRRLEPFLSKGQPVGELYEWAAVTHIVSKLYRWIPSLGADPNARRLGRRQQRHDC